MPGHGPDSVPSGPPPYPGSTRTSVPRVFPGERWPGYFDPALFAFSFFLTEGVLASPVWLAGAAAVLGLAA